MIVVRLELLNKQLKKKNWYMYKSNRGQKLVYVQEQQPQIEYVEQPNARQYVVENEQRSANLEYVAQEDPRSEKQYSREYVDEPQQYSSRYEEEPRSSYSNY